MIKKSIGFTLSEILIALGVIGVVASLLIPQLINGHKSGEAKAQFDTAYAILAKSIADMDADDVPILPAKYNASQSLYQTLKKYHKVTIDCGDYTVAQKNESVCISKVGEDGKYKDPYYTFNKKKNIQMNINRLDDGGFVINNGMLFAIENPGAGGSLWVSIDINGKNKLPNRWGWDLFTFELTNDGILPLGAPGTSATFSNEAAKGYGVDKYCNPNGNDVENGATCGYYAVTNEDYFKNLYLGH